MAQFRVDLTYDEPTNLAELDSVNGAIKKFAHLANVAYDSVEIEEGLSAGEKAASFLVEDLEQIG